MNANNTKQLSQLAVGEKGKVSGITAEGTVRRRILEMGLTKGTEVSIKSVAPMGDPISVLVKGYQLSLRKKEASGVLVEVL